MGDYRKVQLLRFTKNLVRESAESRYWSAFSQAGEAVQHLDRITHVSFAPTAPFDFACASATRLFVYSGKTGQLSRTLTRFRERAYCPDFRSDGRLLVAGSDSKFLQVFDVQSRAVLRQFKGHEASVHVARFSPDGEHVLSASDDKTVRLWSVPAATEVLRLDGHTDYVRCGRISGAAAGSSLFLTGSYDHTVRLWDARVSAAEQRCVMTLDHGAPVEDVLGLVGGSLVASVGGNRLKVWDAANGRLVFECSNHQKTITCLSQDLSTCRVVTGGLDCMVKFYDVSDFSVTHSIRYPQPVTALALSPGRRVLVVGQVDGKLSIRSRSEPTEGSMAAAAFRSAPAGGSVDARRSLRREMATVAGADALAGEPEKLRERIVRTGTVRYYMRGQNHGPTEEDLAVQVEHKQRLQVYDRMLRKFQYHEAVDAALRTGHAVVVCSVFEELSEREALRIALQGRDEAGLRPLLSFLCRYICNPHYSAQLAHVSSMVLDLYGEVLGHSVAVDELFVKLRKRLREEVGFHKQLLHLSGTLDMLMSAATASSHALASEVADQATASTDAVAVRLKKKKRAREVSASDEAPEGHTRSKKSASDQAVLAATAAAVLSSSTTEAQGARETAAHSKTASRVAEQVAAGPAHADAGAGAAENGPPAERARKGKLSKKSESSFLNPNGSSATSVSGGGSRAGAGAGGGGAGGAAMTDKSREQVSLEAAAGATSAVAAAAVTKPKRSSRRKHEEQD